MAIIIPLPTDTLGADGHAAMHSVVAVDIAAPQRTIAITNGTSVGNVGINGPLSVTPISLTSGTGVVLNCSSSNIFTLTPGTNMTLTALGFQAGQYSDLIILTSGSSSDTLTFSTGIRTALPTLTTGTQSGKYIIVRYLSDGNNLIETNRTGLA